MSSLQPIIGTNENQGPTAIAADLTTRLIACTAVGLRFWARWIGGTRYWWDDWLILAAAVSECIRPVHTEDISHHSTQSQGLRGSRHNHGDDMDNPPGPWKAHRMVARAPARDHAHVCKNTLR